MFIITGMTEVAVDTKGRFLMPAFGKLCLLNIK